MTALRSGVSDDQTTITGTETWKRGAARRGAAGAVKCGVYSNIKQTAEQRCARWRYNVAEQAIKQAAG